MGALRTLGEVGFGLLFLMGAGFNAVYTSRHGEEFYGSFARGAWLQPARRVVEKVVIPNAAIVTVLLVVFQVTVAVMILLRGGLVRPGLLAGAGFALMGAAVSNPAGTAANLALAGGQFLLAVTR